MSVLFQRPNGPTRINAVQINQSVLGYCVPVVMGKGKIQQSVLWSDGFVSRLINTASGKGFGSGKNGNQYVYSADVLAGLCDGGANGLIGIGDVWSGQSWLRNNTTYESYTISGTAPSYTPANAGYMTGDHGVSYTVPLSASYSDLGAPAPTALATTLSVAFQRVPYALGQTLSAGTYSVDTDNNYYFSAGDVGTTVQLYYTFALRWVTQQENGVIPSGCNIVVPGDIPYVADDGVTYYSSGGVNPLNGQPLRRVSGAPTVAGTYSVDYGNYQVTGSPGSYTVIVHRAASYSFAAGDINQEVQITYKLDNSSALPSGTQTSLSFELIPGTPTDAPAALLTTNFPSAAIGYPGIAKVLYAPMDLGYGAQIQQNVFEVITADAWGGGNPDCNPVQCILQVLSNPVWGLGAGTVPFPQSAIDNRAGGTWGSGNAGHGGNGAAAFVPETGGPARPFVAQTATAWFAANNFFISPVIDRQDTAASLIGRWLEAGMCASFLSGGIMKLVPFGDTSAASNGATWVAPSSFTALLDDDCFIVKSSQTVKVSSKPWTEAFNKVQVSWSNRENQYAPEITPEEDKAATNRYGSRIEDTQAWDFIKTLASAVFAGSVRVKRNVYTRNIYEFTLPFRFGHLEPMDIVGITTNSAWSPATNNTMQLIQQPARITKIVDNPDGTYDVAAEEYAFGAQQPSAFNKLTASGAAAHNQYADPGDTTALVFEATNRLTGFKGYQLWIGANGSSEDWGGCNVHASMDGTTYTQIGTVDTAARIGTLAASLGSGVDPDTTDSLVVNLTPGSGALESGSTADADQDNTLCYVDGELIAYSTCTMTGQDQYTAGAYLRRGQMGSIIGAHASGSNFLRLDGAVLRYTYDASWAGKTVYLKFQSFNSFGNSAQDVSTLTAVAFAVPGVNTGVVSGSTGSVANIGGVPAATVIQGLVNSGAIPPATYGGGSYQQLTVSPSLATGTGATTFQAYLNGVATSAVTWSLTSGSLGTLVGNVFTPSSSPAHGGAGVLATLTANSAVIGGASASW